MIKLNLRPAPAFQEYASDLLAKREFRLMTLAERGLLMTMRLECWVNKCVPSRESELGLMFGFSEQEIRNHLSPNVLSFFCLDGANLNCFELDAHRQNQEAAKVARAKGGSNGGKATQKKIRDAKGNVEGRLEAKLKPLSRDEMSRDEKKGEELTNKGVIDEHKDWLSGYGDDDDDDDDGQTVIGKTYLEKSRGS